MPKLDDKLVIKMNNSKINFNKFYYKKINKEITVKRKNNGFSSIYILRKLRLCLKVESCCRF